MRVRLTLWLLLLAAVSTVVIGFAVYAQNKREMIHQLDHALEDKLRFFRAFCRQKDSLIGFWMPNTYFERIRDVDDPEFFQYRFQNGRNVRRSASLVETDLPLIGLGEGNPEWADVELPGGKAGRCAGVSFYPDEIDGSEALKLVNLVVAHDGDHIWDALADIKFRIISLGSLALGVLGVVTWLIIRASLSPLTFLTEQIDATPIGGSDNQFRLSRNTAEIAPVVERLNKLMSRVESAIKSEQQFTSNAAHELRNPIAGITLQLELALTDESLSTVTKEFVSTAFEVAVSLHRTITNLLQLARLEAGSERIEYEGVNVAGLIEQSWGRVTAKVESRKVESSLTSEPGVETFHSSGTLLEVAVSNLIENAAEYTVKGGRIDISSGIDSENGNLILIVSNTVENLDGDDVRLMFDRYWRSPKENVVAQNHSGIGLSLCQKIVSALCGTIAAELMPGDKLQITLIVPRAT
jgi:signal transduction histidine kinase